MNNAWTRSNRSKLQQGKSQWDKRRKKSSLWDWTSTGTSGTEGFWNLSPWRYSEFDFPEEHNLSTEDTVLSSGVGQDDLNYSVILKKIPSLTFCLEYQWDPYHKALRKTFTEMYFNILKHLEKKTWVGKFTYRENKIQKKDSGPY